jgi:hypothetical protein
MCYIPELNAGLELYADDSSLYNEYDHVVTTEAENQDVTETLEDMWFHSLDMNANLWHIVYNTCKYGEAFYEVIPDSYKNPRKIKYIRWLPPQYVARQEQDGNLISFLVRIAPEDTGVSYTTSGQGEEYVLNPWQIIHFKLDDKEFEPYGKSVLESGRLAFKQMKLIEDAMLIYRIARAPERRIFRIPVGNLPYRDAMNRVEDFKQKYRKTPWVDPTSGEINYKANPLCLAFDTPIDLLDGRTETLSTLIKEYNEGKENWTYSIDRENGNKIVPGKIEWAGPTRKDAQLVEVYIDNGKSIRCTPDHKFLLRNGEYKEAQYLEKGDSLMPHYTKESNKKLGNKSDGYHLVYNPKENRYRYVHRVVAESIFVDIPKENVVHHIDYNKKNNRPDNLLECTRDEHCKIHNNSTKDYSKLLGSNNGRWKNITFNEIAEWSRSNARSFDDICDHFGCSIRVINSRIKLHGLTKKEFCKKYMLPNKNRFNYLKKDYITPRKVKEIIKKNKIKNSVDLQKILNVSWPTLKKHLGCDSISRFIKETLMPREDLLKLRADKSIQEIADCFEASYTMVRNRLLEENILNHKVDKVVWLDQKEDTGCITVAKYHNFTSSGIVIKNSINDDFFVPTRPDGTGVSIDNLPGGQQLGEIDDVRYFKEKILRTMRIPMSYLTGEMTGDVAKTSLSAMDVRFAKTIERIQKMVIKGLEKLAIVELAFKRFSLEDMYNFQIKLTPPSKIYEMQELEAMTQKLNVIQTALQLVDDNGKPYFPREWLYKHINNFNDQEISNLKIMQQAEMIEKQEDAKRLEMMQQQAQPTEAGVAGGGETPAAPEVGGGGEEAAAGGGETPEVGGGEEAAAAGGEGGAPMEVASKILNVAGKEFLVENEDDIRSLIKFVKEYRENAQITKDNFKSKKRKLYENSFHMLFKEGELKGLIRRRKKNKVLKD